MKALKPSKSVNNTKKFIAWIDEFGIAALAEKLGIDRSTISQWRRGHCWPRVEYIKRMCELSEGRLTYEDIIDGVK